MGTVWTMIVPILVIMIMRKAFKMLGLGDLMNPISAMSLATGGAGKMMRDGGATLKMQKGMGQSASSAAKSAYQKTGKAANWMAGDSKSRQRTRTFNKGLRTAAKGGVKGLGKGVAGAVALRRSEKRAELAQRLKDTGSRVGAATAAGLAAGRNRLGATGGSLAQLGQDYKSGAQGANALSKAFRGTSAALGAQWNQSAALRGKALTASEQMLSVMAAAGAKVVGEGNPDLAMALATWEKKLSPDAPAKISRQYDRELRSRLSHVHDEDEAGQITAALGAERQLAMARTTLGREFQLDGSLSPRSVASLTSAYSDFYRVPTNNVMVDPATGFTSLVPGGENRIPITKDPAVLEAYASHPLTWLSHDVTARKDGEGEAEYAFRMRATLDRAGLLNPHDGSVVDMIDKLGLERGPELTEQLAALAAGRKSDLRDYIGVADPSEQALRDIEVNVRHNFTELDSPQKQAGIIRELRHEIDTIRVEGTEIEGTIANALASTSQFATEVSRANSPVELRASLDQFEDQLTDAVANVFGKLGDHKVSVYSAHAAAGADPSEVLALLPNLDKFQDSVTGEMRSVMNELRDQMHAIRTAPNGVEAAQLARQMESWLNKTAADTKSALDDEIGNAVLRLRDQADRQAQMSNSYGNGVSRPGNFANGSEPPKIKAIA